MPDSPVRWAEVADWSGRTVHPSVSFRDLTRPAGDAGTTPAPWGEAPLEGELLPSQLQALCEVLAGHTGTPERCWFCLWDGWGWIDGVETVEVPSDFSREVLDGPRVRRQIDLDSTYVGGSARLIREVLDDSRFEAVPVEAADPIG